MNHNRKLYVPENALDRSPHPFDILAIFALYQTY